MSDTVSDATCTRNIREHEQASENPSSSLITPGIHDHCSISYPRIPICDPHTSTHQDRAYARITTLAFSNSRDESVQILMQMRMTFTLATRRNDSDLGSLRTLLLSVSQNVIKQNRDRDRDREKVIGKERVDRSRSRENSKERKKEVER